jgi:RNA polymerase sigma-70 factor, ECF subfamily
VLQNGTGTMVRKALEKLPPTFRQVLILRELEGMPYREIADITGMPTGTGCRAYRACGAAFVKFWQVL